MARDVPDAGKIVIRNTTELRRPPPRYETAFVNFLTFKIFSPFDFPCGSYETEVGLRIEYTHRHRPIGA